MASGPGQLKSAKIIFCFAFLVILLASSRPLPGQEKEYTVKAVFLEKFTRFVNWPEASGMADTSKPFVIAIIGENPFDPPLEQLYARQKIRGKKVEIRHLAGLNAISDCHLLFIATSMKTRLPGILDATRNKPILTVGDTEGFAEPGVLINFYFADDKIRFEINESAVQASPLSMSYLLIQVAKIVNPVVEQP